jgi:hypothetical protein
MPGLDNRLENIIGAPLPDWVIFQLNRRSKENSREFRDNNNISYLLNGAFVRVVSSVDVLGDQQNYFKQLGITISDDQSLAQQFILYGGTSKYLNINNKTNYQLRKGFEETYKLLNENEINKYGYRPMPGISSAKITTQGRLGSVRGAVIDFKVWDKAQLDIIDTLYFRLGYSIFIEWGHTNYYDNTGKLHSGEDSIIDPFFKNLDKDELRYQISKKVRESEGNYDAMLGIITNFSFSLNQEGGYDCTLNTISLGVLGESMRINNNKVLAEVLNEEVKQLVNILNKFEETRKNIENKNPIVIPPQVDPKGNPNILDSYPECVRKFGIYVKEQNKDGLANWNSGSYDGKSNAFAIRQTINNTQYFFYSNGTYRTTGGSLKGNYSCDGNYILLDGKNLDETAPKSYKTIIEENLNSAETIDQGSTSSFPIYEGTNVNIPAIININENLSTIINKGGGFLGFFDKKYIAIHKFKTLIPTFDLEKYNITAKLNDLNSLFLTKSEKYPDLNLINLLLNNVNGLKLSVPSESPKEEIILHEPQEKNAQVLLKYTPVKIEEKNNSNSNNIITVITVKKGPSIQYFSYKNKKLYSIELILPANEYISSKDGTIKYSIINNIKTEITKAISLELSGISNNTSWKLVDTEVSKYRIYYTFSKLISIILPDKVYITETNQGQGGYKVVLDEKRPTSKYEFYLGIKTNDIDFIKSINIGNNTGLITPKDVVNIEENKAADNKTEVPQKVDDPNINIEQTQKDQSLKYKSDLEIILKTLQLDSFIRIASKGSDITNLNSIWEIPINDTVKKLFSQGTFSNILNNLLTNNKPENYTDEDYEKANTETRFKYHAAYGFHAGLLSNKISIKELNDKNYLVDYNKLMTRYIIPYKLSQDLFAGSNINYPVYIPFGFFIMILNHSCLLYNIKDVSTKKQIPLIYIDFNPNSNICLSNESMLSTNPYRFMIPFEGNLESYKKIFPKEAQPPESELFHIESKDTISKTIQTLSPFRLEQNSSNKEVSKYRGKFMNVLVNIDYLLNIISSHSTKDENNAVYLKAMLEEIISDMNKSFGNFNVFRLAYNDQADCFYISDDQLIPGDNMVQRNPTSNTQKLNLFGKKSIALSLDIKTEVSSKLANMLAVSANSDTGDQSTAATDASSFGIYNISYKDRYKPVIKANLDATGSKNDKKVDIGMQVSASSNFNSAIQSFYGTGNTAEDQVSMATNYYIERMSKIKNEDTATRASVMIPLSLNFSTDGISGLNMGQGFTIDDELLPSRYTSNGTFLNDKKDHLHKVGFIIVGLDHSIESNRWVSSVRANMFYLKDKSEYAGSIPGSKSTATAFSISNDSPDTGGGLDDNVIINNYPVVQSNYKNVKFGQYGNSNPIKDKINPKLLTDISNAAVAAGVVVTITTAVSGHKKYTDNGNISNHADGNAVDISIIDGKAVRPNIKDTVEKFTNQLINLGYVKNEEIGNSKAFLFGVKDHNNHIHVSNKT